MRSKYTVGTAGVKGLTGFSSLNALMAKVRSSAAAVMVVGTPSCSVASARCGIHTPVGIISEHSAAPDAELRTVTPMTMRLLRAASWSAT